MCQFYHEMKVKNFPQNCNVLLYRGGFKQKVTAKCVNSIKKWSFPLNCNVTLHYKEARWGLKRKIDAK